MQVLTARPESIQFSFSPHLSDFTEKKQICYTKPLGMRSLKKKGGRDSLPRACDGEMRRGVLGLDMYFNGKKIQDKLQLIYQSHQAPWMTL